MAEPIGVQFAPTDEQALQAKKNMSLAGSPEAVRILSLQIPKFAGSRAIAPDALLQAQPSSPAAAVVESILRSMGHGGAAPQPGGTGESGDLADLLRRGVGGGSPTPTVGIGQDSPPQAQPKPLSPPGPGNLPTSASMVGRAPISYGSRPQRPRRYEPTPVIRPGIDTQTAPIPQAPVQRMWEPSAPTPEAAPTSPLMSDYRTRMQDKYDWNGGGGGF